MDLNAQRFCLPYLNAQMVKLLVIEDNVAQMAKYVAQIKQPVTDMFLLWFIS
jgi:hypothetical protein